jgi:hypothetical protein
MRNRDNYILIGRKSNGEKVFVEAGFDRTDSDHEWGRTDHQGTVRHPLRLSIASAITSKYGTLNGQYGWHGVLSCGQARSDLMEITKLEPGWTVADVVKLDQIWREYHLNDMKAGCDHQPDEVLVYENHPRYGYRQIDLENTPRCPHTGYKYGSAWLFKALPDDVIEWISHKFDTFPPAAPVPAPIGAVSALV